MAPSFAPMFATAPTPFESVSTQVLLQRFQSGDNDALNELYHRYLNRVLAAVRMQVKRALVALANAFHALESGREHL